MRNRERGERERGREGRRGGGRGLWKEERGGGGERRIG